MVPIKHILNETGVSEIFKLIVPDGDHAGTYIIKRPEGWNQVDSIVDIDEEFFNVANFIIGDTTKIKLSQFTDMVGYNIVKNVYKEQGGDGRLIFKWIAVKNEVEYDLLLDNFELNLNKYNDAFDKEMKFIEVEIIKSEAQNKFITREDTTVDIFSDKDLDNEDIDPVGTVNIGYKKGFKTLSNFYTYDISQFSHVDTPRTVQSFSFLRSDGYEFGDNTNNYAGRKNPPAGGSYIDQGPFVATNITLSRLKAEISNLRYLARRGDNVTPNVSLNAVIKYAGSTEKQIILKNSVPLAISGINYGEIKIENEIFDIGNLQPGRSLYFEVLTNENVAFAIDAAQDNTSIEVTTNLESPMVKTPAVRLKDALNQVAKSYTSGEITIESNILSSGGAFFNTSISTGMYLRGLPPLYLSQKLKTSFSKLFGDGVSKLMALGYDILNDKLIVEELDYFFKDIMIADFSEKQYLMEGYKIEHDKEIGFNNILSGSKKYSTNLKFDIKNFNTSLEISTPIKSNKNKLDIQTDLIIDEYKIQELIEDKSSSTNDNDDDMVLVDMVDVSNVWDSGVFEDCIHSIDAGNLLLNCTSTAFDTTLIEVGKSVEITEGNNSGTWTVLSIDGSKMKVSKSTGIWEGVADTPIKYQIDTLTKNRTDEGFTGMGTTVRDPETCTNIRHNPKYQLARWWPYFGSGLRKKGNTELLKVANYKNNSEAKMTIVSPEMPNELQGSITVGNDELLSRLRDHKATFFNGERIEINFNRVTFEEFMDLYNNWKFGAENNRLNSRGYIKCNTPEGIYDIYPFGSGAFSHSKAKNTLSIKGKIKGKSVDNPVLLSVTQIDADTVDLTWDYNADYINPVIKIQYSTDGVNWNTLKEVVNVKSDSVTSSIFETFMTGDEVIFRIVANTPDFYNKVSNTTSIDWLFNDWVFREISRSENINCSYSYLTFEIFGSGDFEITWDFASLPGGGSGSVIDLADNSTVVSFDSPYGPDYTEVQTTTLNLSDSSVMYSIQVKNTDNDGTRPIKCPILANAIFVEARLLITINSLTDSKTKVVQIKARTTKGWIDTSPFDPE